MYVCVYIYIYIYLDKQGHLTYACEYDMLEADARKPRLLARG